MCADPNVTKAPSGNGVLVSNAIAVTRGQTRSIIKTASASWHVIGAGTSSPTAPMSALQQIALRMSSGMSKALLDDNSADHD